MGQTKKDKYLDKITMTNELDTSWLPSHAVREIEEGAEEEAYNMIEQYLEENKIDMDPTEVSFHVEYKVEVKIVFNKPKENK